MIRSLLAYILCCLAMTAQAEWRFSDKIEVAPQHGGQNIFHHLDSPGRANIAVSGPQLAVAWEDNHSGSPQVYLAFKQTDGRHFSAPVQISAGKEAYAPVITGMGDGRFAVAWEQDEQIWMRTVTDGKPGQAGRLSGKNGRQVSLLHISRNELLAAWARVEAGSQYIVTAPIVLKAQGPAAGAIQAVERLGKRQKQSYPVLGKVGKEIGLVWEDRRRGHTTLLYSVAQAGGFSKSRLLNEIVKKSDEYGKGSGVTRAALANYGAGQIAATWMDKRNRQTGYDIYAALGEANRFVFGGNQMVQDSFGDNLAQWNPAIAGNPRGDVAVAWYDSREESMDILLSTKTAEGWSDDEIVPPASGAGDQTNPVMVYDADRKLHMVWIHQDNNSGPTRLYYAVGREQ